MSDLRSADSYSNPQRPCWSSSIIEWQWRDFMTTGVVPDAMKYWPLQSQMAAVRRSSPSEDTLVWVDCTGLGDCIVSWQTSSSLHGTNIESDMPAGTWLDKVDNGWQLLVAAQTAFTFSLKNLRKSSVSLHVGEKSSSVYLSRWSIADSDLQVSLVNCHQCWSVATSTGLLLVEDLISVTYFI